MKKFILLIIFAGVCLVSIICLFADFNSYGKKTKTTEISEDKIIFTITTFDGKSESKPFITCLGHSWVEIDNRLDHSIYLNDYEIKPNELLTLSAWGLEGHFGIAYNIEPAFANEYGRYEGRQSISINIEESQIETIEQYISDHPKWKFTENCSYWSLMLWNELVPEEYKLKTQTILYTPKRLQKSFGEYTNVTVNKDYSRAGTPFIYEYEERTELRLCD